MTKSKVSRLEKGETELSVDVARRFASVLGVPLSQLLGEHEGDETGLIDDIETFHPTPGDPLAALARDEIELWIVRSAALDRAGYPPGTVLQINTTRAACAKIKPLQACSVRLHSPEGFVRPIALLRLWVPPRLLIGNSSAVTIPNIDMDGHDARIAGVVEGAYQRTT